MINNPPAPRDFREEPDLAEDVDRVVGPVQRNVRQPYASEQGGVTRMKVEVLHVIPFTSLHLTLVYPGTPFRI